MKKLFVLFTVVVFALNVIAQDATTQKTDQKMNGKMKGWVMMKDGKMMMMKDGKSMPMDKEMTMKNEFCFWEESPDKKAQSSFLKP